MTRSTMACAVAAGAALGLACGAQDTQASAAAGIASPQGGTVRVLGTISATVDGTARTWHVVAGPSAGRPYASGLWTVAPSGRRTIVVAGFDTPTPPLDTFTWNAAGMPTSYGEYTGSTIGLTLRVGAEATPFRLVYPPEDIPALVYAARASLTAVDGTLALSTGEIDVTSVSIAGGTASVSGGFAGTLTPLIGEGGARIVVTNGTFTATGLPDARALR